MSLVHFFVRNIDGAGGSRTPLLADVPYVDGSTCARQYANVVRILPEQQICAGRGGADSCQVSHHIV